jgi:hypothetical protein
MISRPNDRRIGRSRSDSNRESPSRSQRRRQAGATPTHLVFQADMSVNSRERCEPLGSLHSREDRQGLARGQLVRAFHRGLSGVDKLQRSNRIISTNNKRLSPRVERGREVDRPAPRRAVLTSRIWVGVETGCTGAPDIARMGRKERNGLRPRRRSEQLMVQRARRRLERANECLSLSCLLLKCQERKKSKGESESESKRCRRVAAILFSTTDRQPDSRPRSRRYEPDTWRAGRYWVT